MPPESENPAPKVRKNPTVLHLGDAEEPEAAVPTSKPVLTPVKKPAKAGEPERFVLVEAVKGKTLEEVMPDERERARFTKNFDRHSVAVPREGLMGGLLDRLVSKRVQAEDITPGLASEEKGRADTLIKVASSLATTTNALKEAQELYMDHIKADYFASKVGAINEVMTPVYKGMKKADEPRGRKFKSDLNKALQPVLRGALEASKLEAVENTQGRVSETYELLNSFDRQVAALVRLQEAVTASLKGEMIGDDKAQQDLIDKLGRQTPDLIKNLKGTTKKIERLIDDVEKNKMHDLDFGGRVRMPNGLRKALGEMKDHVVTANRILEADLPDRIFSESLKHAHPGSFALREDLKAAGEDVGGKPGRKGP
jgi:hypothetical protein